MARNRDLAGFSTDPGRLLPGEDLAATDPQDATRWAGVYTELVRVERQLVANLRDMMANQDQDVQDELERADVRLLELQIGRMELRLAFWRERMPPVASTA